jgi:ABC-2 type transport system ATP-binding protein
VQIIHRGRLVFSESMDALRQRCTGNALLVETVAPLDIDVLQQVDGVTTVQRLGARRARLQFETTNPADRVAACVASRNWGLVELALDRQTLEQVFVDLTCSEETGPGVSAA